MKCTFVIVGGGISGVSCAETLAFLEPDETIVLISESSLIKTVTNLQAITRTLTSFDVEEKNILTLSDLHSNITVIHDKVTEINCLENVLKTESGRLISYQFLSLCTGGQPNIIKQAVNDSYILGIRDTDSVEIFVEKLRKSRAIALIGNGGIASELIYKIRNTDVHWIIKDKHITATFVDPGAAEIFEQSLKSSVSEPAATPSKRMRYKEEDFRKSGAALGPDWYKNLEISGTNLSPNIKIHYNCEVKAININENTAEFPVEIVTTDETISCDLIVSATGVIPQINFSTIGDVLVRADDGGLAVNEQMQTSVKNIYAVGDVCSPSWQFAKHWFPMKLWTQAHQMGCYTAKCLSAALKNDVVLQDFCFELFAHSTKLFGFKIILLGLYNGQKLGQNYEILLRMTKGHEYIKFILQDNRLQGAVLIGETDLEETCENLILNQIDLSPYGDDILDPNIDIEDYFD